MADHNDLLRRFQPVLRYDSNEQFFADSAEQYMVNPGTELRRKRTEAGNGKVLASAQPKAGEQQLTLGFLGPKQYADGTPVEKDDVIGLAGKDYREQYRRLRVEHPKLNNVVYGHAVESNGRLWLQYWLWYFYNDYQLSFQLGLHEGDWEMVALRMDEQDDHPDVAVYAQHRYGELRDWDGVEKFQPGGERPVVYVARGSHASYFEPGFHQTEAWYDLADGRRRMKHRPKLEILGHDDPAWTRWPGRWGDTLPREKTLESNSPPGPGAKKQWMEPDKMLDNPPAVSKKGKAAAPPEVNAVRLGGRLRIDYDVTKRDPRPHALVVTVNSKDEPAPPQTHTVDVAPAGSAKVTLDVVLDPLKHYDVNTSMVAGEPPKPSESKLIEILPFHVGRLTVPQKVLAGVSRAVAWVRGDRRRR